MEKEYILSFSSFYKAAYAKDVLEQNGIHSVLQKLPPPVTHSCSTGVYLKIESIEKVQKILDTKQIVARGTYLIGVNEENIKTYTTI